MAVCNVDKRMVGEVGGIGTEAVERATGHGWEFWLDHLDEHAATELSHPEIVSILAAAGIESAWWQQQIAVGYEQARGLREVGETANAGYQVGCQRTIRTSKAELWAFLTSSAGIATWLGDGVEVALTPGEQFETAEAIQGEIRTRADGERLRLTWQPPGWARPSTLQLTLSCPRNTSTKTVLRFHHEHLADAETREAMRTRWHAVLDAIEEHLATAAN